MSSRLREKPSHLFEVFLEIARIGDNRKEPETLLIYPNDYKDELQVMKKVPQFVFPCATESTTVEHFTFVLTNEQMQYIFVFCRHGTGGQTCLCVVSCLPWFEVFYNYLNLLAEICNRSQDNDMTLLLRAAYVHDIPSAGLPVTIVAQQEMFSFTAPDPKKLPQIPSNINVTQYFNAIDTDLMIKIFASLLQERRIIVTAKKLSRFTSCVHAMTSLLYPLHWQHIYIPLMPEHLIDYISAPMPYIIGIHSSLLQKLRPKEIADALIIDADSSEIIESEYDYDDVGDLPHEVLSPLKKSLSGRTALGGAAIPHAFMMALVKLIGGYRNALKFRLGEEITFDPEAFVQSRAVTMQPFLEKMLHLQLFQQFIKDRLDMLNQGQGFNDLFELEANLKTDKLNAPDRYKKWLDNMKKQGRKIKIGSRDIFADFKDKAAPMMTNAVQSVKDRSRKAVNGIQKQIHKKDDSGMSRLHSMSQNTTFHRKMDRDRPTTLIGTELHSSRRFPYETMSEDDGDQSGNLSMQKPWSVLQLPKSATLPDMAEHFIESEVPWSVLQLPKSATLPDMAEHFIDSEVDFSATLPAGLYLDNPSRPPPPKQRSDAQDLYRDRIRMKKLPREKSSDDSELALRMKTLTVDYPASIRKSSSMEEIMRQKSSILTLDENSDESSSCSSPTSEIISPVEGTKASFAEGYKPLVEDGVVSEPASKPAFMLITTTAGQIQPTNPGQVKHPIPAPRTKKAPQKSHTIEPNGSAFGQTATTQMIPNRAGPPTAKKPTTYDVPRAKAPESQKEQLLIKFDSVDMDTDFLSSFDPLSPKAQSSLHGGHSKINRSPAFRDPQAISPKRQSVREDSLSPERDLQDMSYMHQRHLQDQSNLFDPFANMARDFSVSSANKVSDDTDTRSRSSSSSLSDTELLKAWDMSSLSHNISAPPSHTFHQSVNYNVTTQGASSVHSAPVNVSWGSTQSPAFHMKPLLTTNNPTYTPPPGHRQAERGGAQMQKTSASTNKDVTPDPFAELVNLEITSQRSPVFKSQDPKGQWQNFK